MEYTVDSLDGVPIYYTKHDLAATRLAVTHTARYAVLFIGSRKLPSLCCRPVSVRLSVRHVRVLYPDC